MSRGTEVDAQFGAWLKAKREAKGISQKRLAQAALGLPYQTSINRIESGVRPATIGEAYAFVLVLAEPLPDLTVMLPDFCGVCAGRPPKGFTCNECGAS